jgi:hypothetical protein
MGATHGQRWRERSRAGGPAWLAHGRGLWLLAAMGVAGLWLFPVLEIDFIPDGVFFCGLGAFVMALFARSSTALVAALLLWCAWSGVEAFTHNPHWPFLLCWAAALLPIYFWRWIGALRVAAGGLLFWCVATVLVPDVFERDWIAGERMALVQLYVFAGIALYITARGMAWRPRWKPYTAPFVTAGATLAVAALFWLSFPAAQRLHFTGLFGPVLPTAWISVTVGVLTAVAALMAWRYQGTSLSRLPLYRQGAFVWLVLAAGLALANLLFAGQYPIAMALGYNILGVAGVVWLVETGVDRGERRIVNLGLAFFGLLVLARFVDVCWALLDPLTFGAIGAALLLATCYGVARAHRYLMARLHRAAR